MASMNKADAIYETVVAAAATPIVFTTGYSCRIAKSISDKHSHFYMVGSMGLVGCVATGVALALAVPVIVIDGDGALAMNPGMLMLATQYSTLPLIHIVLDDQAYSSTGGQPTPAMGGIEAWAESLGYTIIDVTHASLRETVIDLLAARISRPHLIWVAVDPDTAEIPPRMDGNLAVHAARFRSHCLNLQCRTGPAST